MKRATVAVIIALGMAAVAFWGVVVLIVWAAVDDVNATQVTVVNDVQSFVRVAGSCADDPLDLEPGASAMVSVHKGTTAACGVYRGRTYTYSGCIEFSSDASQPATVDLSRAVLPGVQEAACRSYGFR